MTARSWRTLQMHMPHAPVYDIRIQPRWNDLLVATHGRALWAIDSLAPIQGLAAAQSSGSMVFAPRAVYEFYMHADEEDLYTRFAGQGAADRMRTSSISTRRSRGSASPRSSTSSTPYGKLVRRLAGTRKVGEREVPVVSNDAGLNRVIWDLRENGPIRWMGAAREDYRGPRTGVLVAPGRYTERLALGGKAYQEPIDVRADPRSHYSLEQLHAAHDFYARELAVYSRINAALNRLDGAIAAATRAQADTAKRKDTTILNARITTLLDRARELRGTLTADYHNDEDSIQRPGALREDFENFAGGFGADPPSPALRDLARPAPASGRPRAARRRRSSSAGDVATANTPTSAPPGSRRSAGRHRTRRSRRPRQRRNTHTFARRPAAYARSN